MTKYENLPNTIPVFPLSNFIIFPNVSVPLNIFESRYLKMVDDSMKTNKLIGMVQPKKNKLNSETSLHNIGCLGKISSFKETEDGRYLIELKGLIRFEIIKEINNDKNYKECQINFSSFQEDLLDKNEKLKFSDLELIFKDLKNLFEKRGFVINWDSLKKQNLSEVINALAMGSPFTIEEKQILLEAKNLKVRKDKIAEILSTYTFDNYDNSTIQ
jgi:Lon protease-like protein